MFITEINCKLKQSYVEPTSPFVHLFYLYSEYCRFFPTCPRTVAASCLRNKSLRPQDSTSDFPASVAEPFRNIRMLWADTNASQHRLNWIKSWSILTFDVNYFWQWTQPHILTVLIFVNETTHWQFHVFVWLRDCVIGLFDRMIMLS